MLKALYFLAALESTKLINRNLLNFGGPSGTHFWRLTRIWNSLLERMTSIVPRERRRWTRFGRNFVLSCLTGCSLSCRINVQMCRSTGRKSFVIWRFLLRLIHNHHRPRYPFLHQNCDLVNQPYLLQCCRYPGLRDKFREGHLHYQRICY